MNNEINFPEIRKTLVENGSISQDNCDKSENTISVKGEYRKDGSIKITAKSAGVSGDGVFFKGVPVDIEISESETEKEAIKKYLQYKYNVKIWVKVI